MKIPWHKRIYALYKGEDNLMDGTIPEIAERIDSTVNFLRFMNTPAYSRRCGDRDNRLRLVLIEEDEL